MFTLPATLRNYGSQCQSLVKRKGTIYSKVIQVYGNGRMLPLNTQSSLKHPPTHTVLPSPLCPVRPVSGTISQEVCGSASSRFFPVICAWLAGLLQFPAPSAMSLGSSHGTLARILSPLSFSQLLSCILLNC